MLPQITINHIEKELGLRSFHEFVIQGFKALNPTKNFRDNWHIEYLCGELQYEIERIIKRQQVDYDHLIINVPPRSLKSEIVSVYLPLWAWLQDASFEFLFSSYTSTLSLGLSEKSKTVLRSRWFQTQYGDLVKLKRGSDEKGFWGTTSNGYRLNTSTGGTVTGNGGMLVVEDDPQDPRLASSDKERENTINFHKETLSTRLNDPDLGLFLVIQQRLHEMDLTGWLIADKNRRYKHISIPAEYDPETVKLPNIENYPHLRPYGCEIAEDGQRVYTPGALMFPSRFTADFLENQKVNLGDIGYANQYSQRTGKKEGNVLKGNYFNTISWDNFNQRRGTRRITWDFIVDGAYTDKVKNDPSAIGSVAYMDNCLFIRHMRADHIDSAYLREHIEAEVQQQGYSWQSRIMIEPKASGLTVIGTMKKETVLNVEAYAYPTDSGVKMNDSKETRVNAIAPFARSMRIFLIGEPGEAWITKFIEQCKAFPNGANDDMVDVLTMAVLHYLFEMEEQEIEVYN